MLMNIIKGFKEMMHWVQTAMNESSDNDPYAGLDERLELEMLN